MNEPLHQPELGVMSGGKRNPREKVKKCRNPVNNQPGYFFAVGESLKKWQASYRRRQVPDQKEIRKPLSANL